MGRRVVGLDPGTRRIGVAVSDSARTFAFPRPSIDVGNATLDAVCSLLDDEQVDLVVIGHPLSLRGTPTPSTRMADDLAQRLRDVRPDVVIERWDERLTTVSAQRALTSAGKSSREQRSSVDSAAAVVMLQNFLESTRA